MRRADGVAALSGDGGSDDGARGLRPGYDARDYAALLRDPAGSQVAAVTPSAAWRIAPKASAG